MERDAGAGSALPDEDFVAAGARIAADADEVWAAADLILKVKEPVPEEYHQLRADQVLFTYLHLAASKECTDALVTAGATGIAYETVRLPDGSLPLLAPMSEVAGRMAPQVGAHYLQRTAGGRGVLLGGVSGRAGREGRGDRGGGLRHERRHDRARPAGRGDRAGHQHRPAARRSTSPTAGTCRRS